MNTTKRRQSIEINNKTYNRFLKFIEEEMERRGCSQNKMGETLGVTGTTLGEKLRKINRLFADDMCEWMEILGIKIFYPGEEPPITSDGNIQELEEKIKILKRENELLNDLCKERLLRLQQYEHICDNNDKHNA